MQCLARAVARSARAAAEGYGGRRFASTSSSHGASAAKAYMRRQRRVALQNRMRSAHERHQLHKVSAALGSIAGKLDKLDVSPGAVVGRRFGAAILGYLMAQVLFGSTPSAQETKEASSNNPEPLAQEREEISPNNPELD